MDIFGVKAHEEWHQNAERVLRRLVEQVSQLSIDLGQTRMQLHKQGLMLRQLDETKLSSDSLDPSWAEMDLAIKNAREWLAQAEAALDEQWDEVSTRLQEAVTELADQLEEAERE